MMRGGKGSILGPPHTHVQVEGDEEGTAQRTHMFKHISRGTNSLMTMPC